jgi:hypothetical protein
MLESPVSFDISVKEHSSFELIGFDTLRLSLQPQEEKTLPLEALIPRAGAHNLQALHFSIKRDQEEFHYPLEQQWIVLVTDDES